MIQIYKIVNSILNSCTYLISHNRHNWVYMIDCGDLSQITKYLSINNLVLKGVFLTHTHYDHIYGLNSLLTEYPKARVYTTEDGLRALLSPKLNFSKYHSEIEDFILIYPQNVSFLKDQQVVSLFDDINMNIIPTPGHDITCLSYCVGKYVFTGDSYIPKCKLVCTFPRSDKRMAHESENLLKKLECNGFIVMPGHCII